MESFAFYLRDPFVFDMMDDFESIFPDIIEDDRDFLYVKNAETDTIKRNIKKVFKALLLTQGYVYDTDSGILKVKPKDETFATFLNRRHNFIRMIDFFNDIGYVFYHCLLSFIICFENKVSRPDMLLFLRSHLKDKSLYSYKHASLKNNVESVETPFRGLTFNDSNSCYIDSVLMALFTEPSEFIKQRILEAEFIEKVCEESDSFETDVKNRNLIKRELQKIYKFIQGDEEDEEDEDEEDEDEEDEDEDEDEDEEDEDEEEEEEEDEDEEDEEDEDEEDEDSKTKAKKVGSKYYCTNLRKTFVNCKGSERFHEGDTQDAGEFLMYLLRIFELLDVSRQRSYSYGSNSSKEPFVFVSKNVDTTSSVVSIVESALTTLDKDDTHILTKFMIQSDTAELSKSNRWKPTEGPQTGKAFKYRKNVIKQVPQVPFIVFYIKRSFIDHRGSEKFNKIKMYPPEKMLMPSYKTLHLSAIVIHTGGAHYVAIIKRQGYWWYYNDMGTQLYKIDDGSYDSMLKFKGKGSINPLTHGTLYFYT
jgi:hypothetical protein